MSSEENKSATPTATPTPYEGMDEHQVKAAIEADVLVAKKAGSMGLVRGATEKAVVAATGLLEQAKAMSPASVVSAVESAAGAVSGAAPETLTKVSAVNSSIIDGLDTRIDALSLKINEIYHLSPADYVGYMTVKAGEWQSWGLELLHFNYIGYCKEVVSRTTTAATAAAKPVADPLRQQLAQAAVELDKTRESLQAALDNRSAAVKEKVKEQVEAAQTEVKAQIQKATAAANELAVAGAKFVEEKKGSLPAPAAKSVDFILAAPQNMREMAEEIKTKADLDSSSANTLEHISGLLMAVKEVLYAHVVASSQAVKEEAAAVGKE
jgi:hypothetical protein